MHTTAISILQLKELVKRIKTRIYIGLQFQIDIDDPNTFFNIIILSSNKHINPDPQKFQFIYAQDGLSSVETFESFVGIIDEKSCRYIVYDFGFVMQDFKIEKGGFAMLDYIPDMASIKCKTPYSFNSLELKDKLDIGHKTTINDKRDMNCKYVIDKLYKIMID